MNAPLTASRALLLRRLVPRHKSVSAPRRYKSTRPIESPHSSQPPQPPVKPTDSKPAANAATNTIPGPSWAWVEPLTAPYRFYSRSQARRPYLTQFISSLTIYLCGDISAQNINPSSEDSSWDFPRTLRALIIGGISSIPSYRWFMYLGQSFNYSSKILSLATKVLVNQLMFTPIFNTYFFGMQALLIGASPEEIWERVKKTVPTSVVNSCKLWPAVTAFLFAFVKPQNRSVIAGECVQCYNLLCWCFQSHRTDRRFRRNCYWMANLPFSTKSKSSKCSCC